MGWVMAGAYWIVQFIAAACGSLLARAFFGPAGNLAATMPKPGQSWQAACFEAILTFGLVLMVLNLANGPKLNGPFVPLAVGAYILAWGTMGGPYDGASMNPARSFGPDLAIGDLSTWWAYLIGPVAGAVIAVGAAHVLRGRPKPRKPEPPWARPSTGPSVSRSDYGGPIKEAWQHWRGHLPVPPGDPRVPEHAVITPPR
jgi:glycerol uptake facilitator-like aquaporin